MSNSDDDLQRRRAYKREWQRKWRQKRKDDPAYKATNIARLRKWRLAHPENYRKSKNETQKKRRRRDPDWGRNKHLRTTYGITLAQWEIMFSSQGRRCAACGTDTPGGKGKGWHVDHCHEKGPIRGILCGNCNLAIGYIKDDPRIALMLANYLLKHQTDVADFAVAALGMAA